MLSDPQFWVAIAFVIFLLAIFNPIRKNLGSSLDKKIEEIKHTIEEAEGLKSATQVTLSEIKKRQNDVQLEVETMHSNAKEKIEILESQAKEKINEQISKRELLATTKIEQMIRDTNTSIQQHITQTSIEAAVTLLEKKLNQDEKQNLINQSLKDLGIVLKN